MSTGNVEKPVTRDEKTPDGPISLSAEEKQGILKFIGTAIQNRTKNADLYINIRGACINDPESAKLMIKLMQVYIQNKESGKKPIFDIYPPGKSNDNLCAVMDFILIRSQLFCPIVLYHEDVLKNNIDFINKQQNKISLRASFHSDSNLSAEIRVQMLKNMINNDAIIRNPKIDWVKEIIQPLQPSGDLSLDLAGKLKSLNPDWEKRWLPIFVEIGRYRNNTYYQPELANLLLEEKGRDAVFEAATASIKSTVSGISKRNQTLATYIFENPELAKKFSYSQILKMIHRWKDHDSLTSKAALKGGLLQPKEWWNLFNTLKYKNECREVLEHLLKKDPAQKKEFISQLINFKPLLIGQTSALTLLCRDYPQYIPTVLETIEEMEKEKNGAVLPANEKEELKQLAQYDILFNSAKERKKKIEKPNEELPWIEAELFVGNVCGFKKRLYSSDSSQPEKKALLDCMKLHFKEGDQNNQNAKVSKKEMVELCLTLLNNPKYSESQRWLSFNRAFTPEKLKSYMEALSKDPNTKNHMFVQIGSEVIAIMANIKSLKPFDASSHTVGKDILKKHEHFEVAVSMPGEGTELQEYKNPKSSSGSSAESDTFGSQPSSSSDNVSSSSSSSSSSTTSILSSMGPSFANSSFASWDYQDLSDKKNTGIELLEVVTPKDSHIPASNTLGTSSSSSASNTSSSTHTRADADHIVDGSMGTGIESGNQKSLCTRQKLMFQPP